MVETLQDTIRTVRRRAWFAKILYGCGWVLSIITLWLLVIAGVDFILRQNDRLSRMTLSLVFALVVVTLMGRFFLPLICKPLTDLSLAQRIQKRFPSLRHKIATAVEFLQDEKTAAVGSGSMRKAVIQEASEALRELPVREVVQYRHATIAIVTGLLSVIALAVLVFLLPNASKIAVERVMNPFGDTVWPQENDLAFQNTPSYIPLGGLFEAELTDRKNRLPGRVNIEYRFERDGKAKTVVEPMQRVDGMMVARRQDVQHAFQFRAVGGDDQTDWHTLQTVVPPAIENIEFEVHPPAYTGWPLQRQHEQIWGLAGSRVTLHGTATVPLASATLTTSTGESLRLETDGERFSLPAEDKDWMLKKTGTALLRVVDQHGVEGNEQERIVVRVIPESPPTVKIEKPGTYYRASPDATLPLEIFAKDNLALRDVTLHFQPTGQKGQTFQPILLWQHQKRAASEGRETIDQQVAEGDQQLVKYSWDLTAYHWPAGTEIAFYASAYDKQPAEGRSVPENTLQIVDKDTLAEEMALRQQGLFAELARIVKREKDSHERTSQLKIAWEQTGKLTQIETQTLRGIGLAEREVHRAITDSQDGLLTKTEALVADLRHNRIADPIMSEQLERLSRTLHRVEGEQLKPLQSALTSARKHAQNEAELTSFTDQSTSSNRDGVAALKRAETYQEQAIASLQPLVDGLLRSNRYRRLAQNLATVAEEQEKIRETTEGLTNILSGRPLDRLERREQVALRQTAEQQETLRRELEGLLTQMQKTSKERDGDASDSADRLASAVSLGRTQRLSQQMRASQDHLEANQTGQAMKRQARATETLKKMLAALQGTPQSDFAERIEKLRQAEADLARIAAAQKKLQQEQTAALSSAIKPVENQEKELPLLEKQRQSLEDRLQLLARQIENLQALEAAKNLNDAADKTQQAGRAAEQGDANVSAQQDAAAGDDIAKAREQLARARQQAETTQLNSLLARLPEQLKALVTSQKDLLQKTSQLADQQAERPKLTRLDKAKIVDLSRRQLTLIAQAEPIKEGLSAAEILQYVLVGCVDKMQSVAERLGQFSVGSQTQTYQRDVIRQLEMVITSLRRDIDAGETPNQGVEGGGGGQGGDSEQQSDKRSLAEIRLLKLMQMDLNRRITSIQTGLHEAAEQGTDLQPFINQMQQLGPEQAKLAIWTLGLLRDNAAEGEQREGAPQTPNRTEL